MIRRKRKNMILSVLAAVLLGLFPVTVFADETEVPATETAAENGTLNVEWEDIPVLVRQGNPAWLELYSGQANVRKVTESACEAFRDEMNADVELIDESLELIRQRKLELKELRPDAVVDETGKTAAEALREETASEKLLREERAAIVKAVSSVVLPAMNDLKKEEERLEPQFEAIVSSVREMMIAEKQLEAERDALLAENDLLQAEAKAAKAFYERGMISEQEMNEAVTAAGAAGTDLKVLEANLEKIGRSLKKALGIGREQRAVFGNVPSPDKTFAAGIDREADLNQVLVGSEELKNAKDPKSFSTYGSAKAQQAEISRIEGELTGEYEQLYADVRSAEAEYDTAEQICKDERKSFQAAGIRYTLGKISMLSYMERKADLADAERACTVAKLACRKAQERYKTFLKQHTEKM